jgi:putative membrane protein
MIGASAHVRALMPMVLAVLACMPLVSYHAHAADLSHRDQLFLVKTTRGSITELEASKLAYVRAADPAVKRFAEHMVQDHTRLASELKDIADSKGAQLPTDLEKDQAALLKTLSMTKGADFDRLYVRKAGVGAHIDTVKLFAQEAREGTDTELKAFAQRNLTLLRRHLEMARDLPGAR